MNDYFWKNDVYRVAKHEFDMFCDEKDKILIPPILQQYRQDIIQISKNRVLEHFKPFSNDPVKTLQNQMILERAYWVSAGYFTREFHLQANSCRSCAHSRFNQSNTFICRSKNKSLNSIEINCNSFSASDYFLYHSNNLNYLGDWLNNYTPIQLIYKKSWLELLTGYNKIHNLIQSFVKVIKEKTLTSHLEDRDFGILMMDFPIPVFKAITSYLHIMRCDYCRNKLSQMQKIGGYDFLSAPI